MTHDLWAGLNAHIHHYLQAVSLAELVRKQKPGGAAVVVIDQRPSRPSETIAA
jgi:DNA-binding IscR family transcriptional regulator